MKRKKKASRKRKSSSTDGDAMLEELPEEVIIKVSVAGLAVGTMNAICELQEPTYIRPKGFPRAREAESILSAGIIKDQLMFLIKW